MNAQPVSTQTTLRGEVDRRLIPPLELFESEDDRAFPLKQPLQHDDLFPMVSLQAMGLPQIDHVGGAQVIPERLRLGDRLRSQKVDPIRLVLRLPSANPVNKENCDAEDPNGNEAA